MSQKKSKAKKAKEKSAGRADDGSEEGSKSSKKKSNSTKSASVKHKKISDSKKHKNRKGKMPKTEGADESTSDVTEMEAKEKEKMHMEKKEKQVETNESITKTETSTESSQQHMKINEMGAEPVQVNSPSMLHKFKLLMWKNCILLRRHKVQGILEICIPLLFIFILVLIRLISEMFNVPDATYFSEWYPSDIQISIIDDNLNSQASASQPLFTVYYVPDQPSVTNFMTTLQTNFLTFDDPANPGLSLVYPIRGFATENDMLQAFLGVGGDNPLGAIVFSTTTFSTDNIQYTIRMPSNQKFVANTAVQRWYTSIDYPSFQTFGPRQFDYFGGVPGYHSQGFTYLQYAVDATIIAITPVPNSNSTVVTKTHIGDFEVMLQQFPFPPYYDDPYLIVLKQQLPMVLMLSFIYSFVNITKSIVVEKEKRLKETMKIMGLPNYLHWTTWFIRHYAFLLLSSILIVVVLKINWKDGRGILPASDPMVLYVFFMAYIFSATMLAYLVSCLFSKANAASTGAAMIWFMTYFPYFFLEPRYNTMSNNEKLLACILPNTGMAIGCQLVLAFESLIIGSQWSNISKTPKPSDTMSLLVVIIILVIDGIVFFLITIYIEGVAPGEFGVPLPWYFPISKEYWCGNSGQPVVTGNQDKSSEVDFKNFEPPPRNLKAGVRIQHLYKSFGVKKSVQDLSLDMFENQITVLLGHNGAGKTTTMSILTGLFPPTTGTAIINGFDITKNIKGARSSLGICPQYDVLFDEMTCEEHFQFFCHMKGCEDVQKETDQMLKALNLEPKRHVFSSQLSGGMKRRLSVGIALAGGSKVVLLDEPTSGMDPANRRSTWDFLTSEKRNRTILLSTHFMDEADLLGDRIAIMADGQLQTVGSSLFLKKRFGVGYHLVIVKMPGCDPEKVTELLKKHLGKAEVEQDVGAELSYALPDNKSKLFASMFEEMEKKRDDLKIESYGASITTMEEVFMNVGKLAEEKKNLTQPTMVVSIDTLQTEKYKLYQEHKINSGFALQMQQLCAMLVKKTIYSKRNWILLIAQTMIPVLFMLLVLVMLSTTPDQTKEINLRIGFGRLPSSITTLACKNVDAICTTYDQVARGFTSSVQRISTTQNFDVYILNQYDISLADVTNRYIVGMEKNDSNKLVGRFNNQPYHGLPLSLNLLTNALFRNITSNPAKRIILNNFPLPLKDSEKVDDIGVDMTGFQIGFNIVFGMSFLASGFVVFLIKERECKAKHLQFVSGAKFTLFWLANFLFDYIIHLVTCILVLVLMIVLKPKTFTEMETLTYVFILLLLYGWACIPLMYLCSYAFSIPASGFTKMTMINIFSGQGTLLVVFIMRLPQLNMESTADTLDNIFSIFPNYNLGASFTQLSANAQLHESCPKFAASLSLPLSTICSSQPTNPCCTQYPRSYLDFELPGIGKQCGALVIIGLTCFIIIIAWEAKLFEALVMCLCNRKSEVGPGGEGIDDAPTDDSDVAAEAVRIRTTKLEDLKHSENLIIKDLKKVYGKFTAVQCLNLGVKKKECFGLLGVNGAGKTTTFKMLTGDFHPSSGDAYICGYSINSEIKKVQKNLGYCPQFDALIDEMTGRETIQLFARLRGIREAEINNLADVLGSNLLFMEHIDKKVGPYSGGNKRKLSTALALVGNPPVVFLDEPTTGMDPMARRHLWNCISKVREAGASIVLTTHSMEECEALCTRLVVMVNGKFRCLGSTQHLKSKFGDGYTVIAQISTKVANNRKSLEETLRKKSDPSRPLLEWEREIRPLRNFLEKAFPGAVLKDVHPGYVHYHVGNTKLNLGDLFRTMEEAKPLFKLEAYSVGQTSLEQVFLHFAAGQASDD